MLKVRIKIGSRYCCLILFSLKDNKTFERITTVAKLHDVEVGSFGQDVRADSLVGLTAPDSFFIIVIGNFKNKIVVTIKYLYNVIRIEVNAFYPQVIVHTIPV